MRLQDFSVATMHQALHLYLQEAYGDESPARQPDIDWETCQGALDVLASFKDDTGAQRMRKYSLRLGNCRYPFMKMVFQELLIRDSFYFAVDTHDDLDIKKSFQDYEKWLEIKHFNNGVKERVIRAWQKAGIPTFAAIVAEVEAQTPSVVGEPGKLILIVDDEPHIALGVEAILKRSGYSTRVANSGEEALAVLNEIQPDLIISDLEMDGMTGLELADTLRKDKSRPWIPFILATAATVGSSNFFVIDGYLVKPFDTKVLLIFVKQYLDPERQRS